MGGSGRECATEASYLVFVLCPAQGCDGGRRPFSSALCLKPPLPLQVCWRSGKVQLNSGIIERRYERMAKAESHFLLAQVGRPCRHLAATLPLTRPCVACLDE